MVRLCKEVTLAWISFGLELLVETKGSFMMSDRFNAIRNTLLADLIT